MPSAEHEGVVTWIRDNPIDRSMSWVEQRAFYDAMVGAIPLPDDIRIESVEVAGRPVDFLSVADADNSRVLLHLHGGGYVLGSNPMYREFGARLARATKVRVMLLDYRLAPEHPFPGALEDALAAYRYLLDQGVDPKKIAVSGDSAGGGLALVLARKLGETGEPVPAALICLSPWTDLAMTGESCIAGIIDDPMMDAGQLRGMADAYAGGDLLNPDVSPLYGSVEGLPPVMMMAGTRELLRDDSRRIRPMLEAAGVALDYFEGEGLVHVWPVMVPPAPESAEALARIAAFLDRHLA